jgi:hypothetical protein
MDNHSNGQDAKGKSVSHSRHGEEVIIVRPFAPNWLRSVACMVAIMLFPLLLIFIALGYHLLWLAIPHTANWANCGLHALLTGRPASSMMAMMADLKTGRLSAKQEDHRR